MAKNTKYGVVIGNIPFIDRRLQKLSTTIYADSDIQALSGVLIREARAADKKDNEFLKFYEDLRTMYENKRTLHDKRLVTIYPIGHSSKPSPEGKQMALKFEI